MSKLWRWIILHPGWMIGISLLLFTVLAMGIAKVYLDNDILHWFSPQSKIGNLNYHVNEIFENSNPLIIMLELPSPVLLKENLVHIRELSLLGKQEEGISSVYSITEIEDIQGSEDEMIISRLFPDDILSMPSYDTTTNIILSRESFRSLLSKDGYATAIILAIEPSVRADIVSRRVKKLVNDYLANHCPDWKIYHGGTPNMLNSISQMVIKDLSFLVPLVSVVVLVVLLVSFRSLKGTFLPLSTVLIATGSAMGIMGYLGMPLTTFGVAIPVVLIAVGNAYGIHVVNEYYEKVRILPPSEALYEALRRTFLPVLMSAITTFGGFLSIAFANEMLAAKNFGIISAFGVLLSLIFTFLWLPAWICIFPKGKANLGNLNHENEEGIFSSVAELVFRYRIPVLGIFIVIGIVALYFLFKVEIKVDYLAYFDKKAEVSQITAKINHTFDGSFELKLYAQSDATDPVTLRALQIIEETIRFKAGGNTRPNSLVNIIASLNNGMVQFPAIPESQAEVENLFFFIEGNEMVKAIVNEEKDQLLISFLLPSIESRDRYRLIDEATQLLSSYASVNIVPASKTKETLLSLSAMMLYNRLVRAGHPLPLEDINEALVPSLAYTNVETYEEQLQFLSRAMNILEQRFQISSFLSKYDIFYALSPLLWKEVPIPGNEIQLFKKHGVTGLTKLFTDVEKSILRNQLVSLGLIVLIVVILNTITFHSLLEGLLSLLPIIFTILVNFAIMGAFRIPMDFITVTIAAIAVGAGIDYTIHFLSRYLHEIRQGKNYEEAFYDTFRTTGKGIIFNSLSVGLGFAVLMFSSIVPLRSFGLLMAVTMLVSASSALTLLPVSLLLLRKALKLDHYCDIQNTH
ncbi:efflux RND transporter permease subunit [Thermospira aquatica]|uniref:MMPL family transporter n=1 Tax=Thermospira aquatica TaxID=2828656 RepID=A0AAX3BBX4_9SPIR|nr:MMPL family transporter [Thermospira aquatica]URA09812.1 MMPL family transporter [Thermospira aquatica]